MSACSWLYCQEKTPKESVLTPTGFPFSAETWITNRPLLLALWGLVCVCVALSLSFSLTLLFEGWTMAAGSAFFFCYWSFGGLETSLCVWICVVLEKKRACLCACPVLHFMRACVCVQISACVCAAEQQDPGCHSAEQWQSWGSCTTRQCCRKQRGDLEEKVFAINGKPVVI